MKKSFFTILAATVILAALTGISFAKTVKVKADPQKKAIEKWCNVKKFKLAGTGFQIMGIEKIAIGDLEPQWTCHYRFKPTVGAYRSMEYWWTGATGQGSRRELEHHYKLPEWTLTDSAYVDYWSKTDKKTKKKQNCQYFSFGAKTYCM